jgi:hypothetical protein
VPLGFNKLREAKKQPPVIDPVEIFRRLPKKAEIKDLYGSQTEVLNAWFADRTQPDYLVNLHTGGGKTLAPLPLRPGRQPLLFTVGGEGTATPPFHLGSGS